MDFLKEAENIESKIIDYRRELHKIPECGFYLPKTSAYIKKQLDELGIEYKDCGVITEEINRKYTEAGYGSSPGVTGIVAQIGTGESPCIILRGDIDALPMQEKNDEIDYASQHDGNMHSCGHDAHAAMLLGAAAILKKYESELKGTVKFMFQPGEEWGLGSKLMIDDGLLDNPKVDRAFGIHVMPIRNSGELSIKKGTVTQSIDTYIIEIQGKGGHTSQPELAIDPIMIATQLYTQLNLIFTREVSPLSNVTFSIGAINAGTAANIIPDTATIKGAMRSYDPEIREHLLKRIPEIVDHVCEFWRGTYNIIDIHLPTTYNDPEFVDEVSKWLNGIPTNIDYDYNLSGAEDFSYISQEVPSVFGVLGAGKPGSFTVHHPSMVLDESVFKTGAACHAAVAYNFLNNR